MNDTEIEYTDLTPDRATREFGEPATELTWRNAPDGEPKQLVLLKMEAAAVMSVPGTDADRWQRAKQFESKHGMKYDDKNVETRPMHGTE
jgi:hypothetical protein